MSLLTFERLFWTSNLSTAFILNKDSILAINVRAITLDQKGSVPTISKFGVGISVSISWIFGIAGTI